MPGSRRPRYLATASRNDLARKMAFVAGTRQVGKTALALGLPGASARHRHRAGKRPGIDNYQFPQDVKVQSRTMGRGACVCVPNRLLTQPEYAASRSTAKPGMRKKRMSIHSFGHVLPGR